MKNPYFLVSFLFTITATPIFGYLSKPAEMGLVIVAGAFGMAFSNIDKFKKVSGAGFSAELKEITEKTNEVKITYENIKNLTGNLVASIQELIISDNSIGGIGSPEMILIKTKLDKLISQFNLDEKELNDTSERFEDRIMFKFCDRILQSLIHHKLLHQASDVYQKLKTIVFENGNFISPVYFEQFSDPNIEFGYLNTLILQYKEFSTNYKHKEKIIDM